MSEQNVPRNQPDPEEKNRPCGVFPKTYRLLDLMRQCLSREELARLKAVLRDMQEPSATEMANILDGPREGHA